MGINYYRKSIIRRLGHLSVAQRLLLWSVWLLMPAGELSGQGQKVINAKGKADVWVAQRFAKGAVPPFSFVMDGRPSGRFIRSWDFRMESRAEEGQTVKYIFAYSDRRTGLQVKCDVTAYNEYDAVEWVLRFINGGAADSPLLENVQAVSHDFHFASQNDIVLHYNKGSNAGKDDFAPMEKVLTAGEEHRMAPSGGRGSSDHTAFPFFNIECREKGGIIAAVGWSGNWYASLRKTSAGAVTLEAGMETMQLRLLPGETIRTPSICLLFWDGSDRMAGHNSFRRFILDHHSPKVNGKVIETPLAAGISRGGPSPCNEFTCLTESYAVATVQRFQQFDIVPEVCWIDAGWYEGGDGWWEGVGNWTVDAKRFPRGLRPVADAVHEAGAKLLLWFEPERVRRGTRLEREHPGWLLPYKGTANKKDLYNYETYMLDLGNPEVRLWLTDFVTGFLRREGVDYFRQDFNWVDAKSCWELKDRPGRIGISEIRHIEGLYAFWDSLRIRFPELIIDNCASGGRRLDLESISRSVPLWRSDYGFGEPDGYQNHAYGLNFYLPLHGTGLFKSALYDFRSSMSSSMVLFWDIHSSGSSVRQMQKCMTDFKKLRPYYYGDYYPLTRPDRMDTDSIWVAYQLDRPKEQDGIILAFRRKGSKDESLALQLKGLDAEARYELYDEDARVNVIKTGRELSEGFKIDLKTAPGTLLITYKLAE